MEAALQQLEAFVVAGNVDAGMEVLQQIKIARLTAAAAAGTVSDAHYAAALECGVFLAVTAQDLELFERHMHQLQPLYASIKSNNATTGSTILLPRQNHIIGLNLMALLVTASSSEFHSELELLSKTDQETDPFLQFPISLERKLMVGIYDEILSLSVPHPSYNFFMDQLVTTVRDAIADCMEVSYATLTLPQAAEIMKFDAISEIDELKEYIATSRDDWIVEDDVITFSTSAGGASSVTAQDIPSQQWIKQMLSYATEMERIV
jgi:26S proteasome regulatory subunit N12